MCACVLCSLYENLLVEEMPTTDRRPLTQTTAAEIAPKLAAMADSIVDTDLKTLVLLGRPGAPQTKTTTGPPAMRAWALGIW